MTEPADLVEVGRISKAHGLRGDVVVAVFSEVPDRFAPSSLFEVQGHKRRVEQSRRHQERWLVKFEGIDDRTSAEALRGTVLRAERVAGAPDGGWWVDDLIGRGVATRDGALVGRVDSVEANPAHDLLVLDTGHLVPVVFVVETDGENVVIDPPPGLLEL